MMVQSIMDLGQVPVAAFGACLHNQNMTGRLESKEKAIRKFKFCIAIENSIEGRTCGSTQQFSQCAVGLCELV